MRNSGAKVVVEGVGDHGCEYMTGGRVVILGNIGRNFAAGMSGGIAYIYDNKKTIKNYANADMVYLEALEKEDLEELKLMIVNHKKYTNSKKAAFILDNWQEEFISFIKIMPKDYKNALQKNSQINQKIV